MTAKHLITNLMTRSPRGLSPSTIPSKVEGLSDAVPRSAQSNVHWLSVDMEGDEPLSLPDFDDVADIVADLESDPKRAASLARARKALSQSAIAAERLSPIARLRLEMGWSQAKLAQALGTSQSHVARLESKNSDPQFSTLRKVAAALGEPVGRLAERLAVED